jgi:hypothetical protein
MSPPYRLDSTVLSSQDLQYLFTRLPVREYRLLLLQYRTLLHTDLQRAQQYHELLNCATTPTPRHVLAPIQDQHSDKTPIL